MLPFPIFSSLPDFWFGLAVVAEIHRIYEFYIY